jgi:GTP 3',8-cyclase
MSSILDSRSRPLRDLRISVTDRCNFRCTYCMPREIFGRDYAFLPRAELLTFEEITRVARAFANEGVSKIRLTGGEPLLRRDLDHLVAMLANVDGISDIALTTNGSALAAKAQALKDAGLNRVTVSLDALDDDTFTAMNDVGFPVARVLAGIDAAASAGLTPVKVNMVIKRGVNDHAITPMAAHFRASGHILRFIEYMDVGATNGWWMDEVMPAAEIISRIEGHWPLEPIEPNYPGEVATRYRYLFAAAGHDLRSVLRQGASDEALITQTRSIWRRRADRYSELRRAEMPRRPRIEMSYIGG